MVRQAEREMRLLKYGLAASIFMLVGCLEPQPAAELNQRPSTAFNITTIAKGLNSPWSAAELPDGTFLVTEKAGQLLWVMKNGDRTKISGLPKDIFVSGQGGLLEIVLAPDYQTSREVYLSYAYGTKDANGTALLRAKLEGGALQSPTVIFRASPPKAASSHFGGKIRFLPDDTVVLTLGDGFSRREDAQNADTHLGKLVRLTRDGGVPTDNPFVGQAKDGRDFKPQIYSIGHRNVQGLALDAETGLLWSHEHGPRGGDELNLIEPGANYGWPLATKGRDYQGARISPYESFEGTVDPIHSWVPSIAPSGLVIYRGALFPEWNGDALIGGLASRDLRRVDLENGKSVGEEDLLSDLNGRIRDVRQARDGAVLVLIEGGEGGRLLRMAPKQ